MKNAMRLDSTKPPRVRKLRPVIGALALGLLAGPAVQAQTIGTWNVNSGGLWSAPGNWSGGVPGAAGDLAATKVAQARRLGAMGAALRIIAASETSSAPSAAGPGPC